MVVDELSVVQASETEECIHLVIALDVEEVLDGSDENAQSDEAEENVVLGEVKSVSDTEITIAVGTMKEMGQPGGNGQGQTITITENTVITKQSGGMQQGQTGGDGQNGGVPEKPDGDGQDGEAPEKSDGETSEADGQTDADNQDSEKSEDDGQNSEAPEKPDGDQNGGAPDGNGQGADSEEISLSDIQEGDVVSITLDEEFVVHDIKVIEGEKGLFIAMPSRKASDGEYRDIAHPINSATREQIQTIILDKYQEVMAEEAENEVFMEAAE